MTGARCSVSSDSNQQLTGYHEIHGTLTHVEDVFFYTYLMGLWGNNQKFISLQIFSSLPEALYEINSIFSWEGTQQYLVVCKHLLGEKFEQ